MAGPREDIDQTSKAPAPGRYQRRIDERTQVDVQPNDDEATRDYWANLKKFERHDDMAAEPTRDKTPPKIR